MRCDYHMHSAFSVDSEEPMRAQIEHAIRLGLDEICFTEHVDYEVYGLGTPEQIIEYGPYFEAISQYQKQYEGQISIKAGIEFGAQLHTLPKYERDLRLWEFDFILLSVHQIDGKELWLNQYQDGKTQEEYNQGYYAYLYEMVKQFKGYHCLAHLDLVKRYDKAGIYDDSLIMPWIDKILTQVIKDGKGIEVNTSSFRYHLPDLMPSRMILKRYLELGGTVLTIGSDSHMTAHTEAHFEEVKSVLKEIGFTHLSRFEKGQAIAYPID